MLSSLLFCFYAKDHAPLNIKIINHSFYRRNTSNSRHLGHTMSVNDEPQTTSQVNIDLTTATKLLDLMKEKNLDEFISILHNNVFNIDHYYKAPENGTLLEIACRSYGYSDFVKLLIVYGTGGIMNKTLSCNGQINQVENSNSDCGFDNACETIGNAYEGCNQQTYLQYACNMGFVDVVDELLKMGFDPNEHYPNSTDTPMKIAARNGYHNIVSILINCPEISLEWSDDIKPILESVLDHIFGLENVPSTETDTDGQERDYYKCLECILKKIVHVTVKTKMPKPKRKLKSHSQPCIETES